MSNLFRIDSKVYEFLTLLVNLVILNILWLISCVPVITVGAATVAMYHTVMNYITKRDDAVVKPFFKAFLENFRQATPIWLLQLAVGCMFCAEYLYLSSDANIILLVVLSVLVVIFMATSNCYYGLIARYKTKNKQALWNAFALSARHPLQSISIALLSLIPAILLFLFPNQFLRTGLFWLLIGCSLTGLLIGQILMSIFSKYEQTSKTEEDINA